MIYKLEKENSKFKITGSGIEILDLNGRVLEISFIKESRKYEVPYYELDKFFKALESIKNLRSTSIFIKDGNSKSKLEFFNVDENLELTKSYYKFQYAKDTYVEALGFADYSYTNYFMPKWSTTFKFQHANHCKMVEPLFTDLNINAEVISKIINLKDDPDFEDVSKLEFLLKNKKVVQEKSISNLQLQGFVSEDYLINSKKRMQFSEGFDYIYIKRLQDIQTTIKIKGIQNNSFVEEQVTLNDNSVVKLQYNYQTIYNLEIVDYNNLSDDLDFNSFTYTISNSINIRENNLTFHKRKDESYFEIEGEFLVYKRKDSREIKVFNLGFDVQVCNIYIDSLDKIYVLKDNIIYTGRVEAKLDLQIDRDITYNNTNYI